ncbi:MAG: hypothetical protein PHU63_03145 [Candidatus ainarchaeum sp.]|nr:hypothetical protein [Candidatus ainarchaeum sp.]
MKRIPGPSETIDLGNFKRKSKKPGFDLVWAALAVILIIIILYAVMTNQNENGGIILIPNQTTDNTTNGDVDINSEEYILGLAISTKNYSLCEKLEIKEQECYEALSSYQEEACMRVDDYNKKKNCIFEFTLENNNTDLCWALEENERNECGLLIDPCYNKEDVELEICMALENNDVGFCESESCIYEYAKLNKDGEACELFSKVWEKVTCESLVEGKNKCNELVLLSEKDYCNYNYAMVTKNSKLCDSISEDSVYSYNCYLHFAIEEKKYKYCEKIYDFNDRWKCLRVYSISTGDIAGCDNIDPRASSNYESCYYTFAINYYEPALCNKVETQSKYLCYNNAINQEGTPLPPEKCEEIGMISWKDSCYRTSAKKNNDSSICELIAGSNTKQLCLEEFLSTEN